MSIVAFLELKNVTVSFGGLTAVSAVNLAVEKGELVGLIGPNGAGKTTIFNLITGVYRPTTGEIYYRGERIDGLKPHLVANKGITRTFQNIRLFSNLTVLDNVKLACHLHARSSLPAAILRLPRFRKEETRIEEESLRLLRIFNLEERRSELAKNLPYGEQRRLEVARALAAKPGLLLLDEPAAGMNPQETQELQKLIRRLQQEFGLTILLIEHDMNLVMGLCERIYVLDYGVVIAEGTPEEIRRNPRVIEAYLGEEAV